MGSRFIFGSEVRKLDSVHHQSTEIDGLLGQSTLTRPSSIPLGWRGLAVERRAIQPTEKPELAIDYHFLLLWTAQAEGETERKPGAFSSYRKLPNTITACPPGIRPATRSAMVQEVVACVISPEFLLGVEAELDLRPTGPIQELYGTDDVALRDLLLLLTGEAEAGGANGSVYAESLSTALATRLLFVGRSLQQPKGPESSPLPRRILRRVIDRMEAGLDADLTLAVLASESGYSRTHFTRMFKAATGQTPHRYLLELRLRKAQSMLTDRATPLIDIALACGFSSHAHLSAAFRSHFGVAPSAYRRNH
jgi:AraC family transcriptional regulator